MDKLSKVKLAVKSPNFLGSELYGSCSDSIKRVIRTDADVLAWVPLSTTLSYNNITDFSDLAAEKLYAKALGL